MAETIVLDASAMVDYLVDSPLASLVSDRIGGSEVNVPAHLDAGVLSALRHLGLAIGAATAKPKRPVALFTGDGGFMLSMQDLDSARLAAVDLTVIILNDERYGSEVKYLDGFGLPHWVITQDLPDVPTPGSRIRRPWVCD